jgi:hypothetical protein
MVYGQFGELWQYGPMGWESSLEIAQFGGGPVDVYVNSYNAATLADDYALTIPFGYLTAPYTTLELRTNPFVRASAVIASGEFLPMDFDWYGSSETPAMTNEAFTFEGTDYGLDGGEFTVDMVVPDWWTKDGVVRKRRAADNDAAAHALILSSETERIDQWTQWLWVQPEYLSLAIDSPYTWTVARFDAFDGQLVTVAQTWHSGLSISLELNSAAADHDSLVGTALIPSIEGFSISAVE